MVQSAPAFGELSNQQRGKLFNGSKLLRARSTCLRRTGSWHHFWDFLCVVEKGVRFAEEMGKWRIIHTPAPRYSLS
jgi:hypothetical protein